MLQKIHQRRLLPFIFLFLWIVITNFIKAIDGEFGSSSMDMILSVLFTLMLVFYTYVIVKSFIKIKKIKEKLQ